MNPRRRSLGFTLAAVAMLGALVLRLSSEAVATLPARPNLLALSLAAALSFAIAAWIGGSWATVSGFAGVLCAVVTTLTLLHGADIGGPAATGFWVMVLAVWLGAALCVTELASVRPRDDASRRMLDLAIPLLFGAVVFYLWEVLVRGFGVPSVIMPYQVRSRRGSRHRCRC
jgi:NitT/TauT family transport system permease protein